jgi:iron(III) transport system permease protein
MGVRRQPTALYALALAVFCVTAMLPLGVIVGRFVWDCVSQPASMAAILIDSRQAVLLGRSLAVAGLATWVALILGLPSAFALARPDLPFRGLCWTLVLVPLLIPPYVMAGAWIHLLSPQGWVNRTMVALLGPGSGLKVQSAVGCAWCLGLSFFPVVAFIVSAGLAGLDRDLQDLARLQTNGWGVFRHATLPQIRPHLVASVCLVLVFVLGQYSVPSLLGINTYPVEIFAQFSAFYNETAAVAAAIPLVLTVSLLILLQRWAMGSRDYVRLTPSSGSVAALASSRGLKVLAVAGIVGLFIVAVLLPFGTVLASAGGPGQIWTVLKGHADWVLYTSVMAVLAALVSTAAAFLLGHLLAHGRGAAFRAMDVLCWLVVAVPGTVVALGYLRLSAWFRPLQEIDAFGLLLLLAYVGMFSAFSVRVFQAAHRRSDPYVDEAASLDCPTWYQKAWFVDLRIQAPSVAVSLTLVFVLVASELNATILLVPPGKTTLAVSVDNLLHYGASAAASALCLIEACLVVGVVLAGLGIARLAGRRARP